MRSGPARGYLGLMSDEQRPPDSPDEPVPTAPPLETVVPPSHPGSPSPTEYVAQPAAPPGWGGYPPWPGTWGPPPPSVPPPVPFRRDRVATAVVLFVFGGLFLIFFAFLLLAYTAAGGEAPRLASRSRIGVVEIKGEIGTGRGLVDSEETLKVIKGYMDDEDMKAVVVRIDSPGGEVAPSQEIYDELRKLAEKKEAVVCSMGSVAASGGFYIAMACPHILAEPGTLTGSIGVISMFPNFSGLAKRFDVKLEVVKSGRLKDAGSAFRDMTPEERAYWQGLIDDVYRQFLDAVVEGRAEAKVSEAEVRRIADGRVITGQQALELRLIDDLGNFNDAVDLAKEAAKIEGEPRLIYPSKDGGRLFGEILGDTASAIARSVRSEIHHEASAAARPGLYFLAR